MILCFIFHYCYGSSQYGRNHAAHERCSGLSIREQQNSQTVYPLTTKTDCTGKHYIFLNEIIVISLFIFFFLHVPMQGFTGHGHQVTQATNFVTCNIILVGLQCGTFLALAD
jgi:hypothetical protein